MLRRLFDFSDHQNCTHGEQHQDQYDDTRFKNSYARLIKSCMPTHDDVYIILRVEMVFVLIRDARTSVRRDSLADREYLRIFHPKF